MIIFDTSVLFGSGPDDQKFDLLRALKQAGQQQVGIPWMVREELVAQRVLKHIEAHRAAVSATNDLNRSAPWLHERGPKSLDRDEAAEYWRREYEQLFQVIETSVMQPCKLCSVRPTARSLRKERMRRAREVLAM